MIRRRVRYLVAAILVILGLTRLGNPPRPTSAPPPPAAGIFIAATAKTSRPLRATDSLSDLQRKEAEKEKREADRRDLLARLAYAQAWEGPLPAEQAAFRAWTKRYLLAPSMAAQLGLIAEGVDRARDRRPSILALIARDPQHALAVTVPAEVRQRLPAIVLAALETRVAGRGELSLLAAIPAPNEPNPGPALRRIAYVDGVTRTAFTYGRREEQLTKENTFLHGIALDDRMAVHESPVRVLEPAEEPANPLPPTCADCGTPVDTNPALRAAAAETLNRVNLGGQTWRLHAGEQEIVTLEQRLVLAEDQAQPRLSESVRVGLAASIGETGYTLPATAAEAPTAQTVGLKQVLVLRVDFSDVPGEVVSQSTAQAVVGDLSATFLEAVSYGQTSLAVTVSATVYRLPQTAAAYALANNTAGLHADARAAASADYTIAQYERIIVVFPSIGTSRIPGSQITFGGLASTGGTNVWINGAGSFAYTTVSHELGHTYGLPHANLWKVADGDPQSPAGTTLEYGDPFDMMSSTTITGVSRNNRHHFGPWFKNRLGWLPDAAVSRVGESGVYRIYRFDSSAARRDRPLALRVFRDGVRWYWVGLRQNFAEGSPQADGASITWGFNNRQQSQLLDLVTSGVSATDASLPIGATFSDPLTGLTMTPVARGGEEPDQWLDVQVTFPPGGSGNVVASWGREGALFFSGNTGLPADPAPETHVPLGLRGVTQVAGGDQHAIALLSDGSVVAWGDHVNGQTTLPPRLPPAASVAAGGDVSGIVARDGSIRLWGQSTGGLTTPPPGLGSVRQLAIARNHALALRTDGTVVAWGSNSLGQSNVPENLESVVAVAAGTEFSLALKADGTVVPWGAVGLRTLPAGLSDVVAISAAGVLSGGQFAIALKRDGTVAAWGANNTGQTTVPAGLEKVVGIAAGAFHALAVTENGQVVAWGQATSGRTVVPPALPYSTAVAASATASFALLGSPVTLLRGPTSHGLPAGGSVTLSVEARGLGALSYQWRRNGAAIAGATASTLTITGLFEGNAGMYDVRIFDARAGYTLTSAPASVAVLTTSNPGRLINLSLLAGLFSPTDAFTVGTVIGGAGTGGTKPLLVRAVGPSLAPFGVGDPLTDPALEFFADTSQVGSNNDWEGAAALSASFASVGAFPFVSPSSKDAALYQAAVAPGGKSIRVTGANGGVGTVLAELYDATPGADFGNTTPRLINVSVLKEIGSGFTVGFVVGGGTSRSVLIRAVGPGLATVGVPTGFAPNPKLTFFSGTQASGENDDWADNAAVESTAARVGAFALPAGSRDASLLTTLPPGSYSVQVRSADGAGGLVLVEVYEVP